MNRIKYVLVAGESGIIGSYLKQTYSTKNFTFFSSKDCDLISNDLIKNIKSTISTVFLESSKLHNYFFRDLPKHRLFNPL
mgnify:CR=1 FL=1